MAGEKIREVKGSQITFFGIGEILQSGIKCVAVRTSNTRDIFLGKSDNLHGAIMAQEESKLAFAMLVETRNKTVESIQELMRINVG